MPTYTDVSRLKAVVPAVNSATSVQSNELAFFITNAEAIINGKLAKLSTPYRCWLIRRLRHC